MKTYGSAVLTALQARYLSIDEIADKIPDRRFKAFLNGGSSEDWLCCFWKNMAITEAQRCRKNSTNKIQESKNLQT